MYKILKQNTVRKKKISAEKGVVLEIVILTLTISINRT